jgi:rubrerythrin
MGVNKNIKGEIDWARLSFVEMGSGIEVFYIARLLRNEPLVQKAVLEHALDEYRHSKIFRDLAKTNPHNFEYNSINKCSTTSGLLDLAGLAKSSMDRCEINLIKWCCYAYVGEYRAIEFNNQCKKIVHDTKIIEILNQVEKDEERHASGVREYLMKYPYRLWVYSLAMFKAKYFYQKIFKFSFIEKLQEKTTGFLAIHTLRRFPSRLCKLRDSAFSLSESLFDKETMV